MGHPLAGLDLNLLVALDALLRHASVSDAARELGLSQPAASRALDRLRATLDDPLLVRVGRRMVPTGRARELRAPVASALLAARDVFSPPARFDPLAWRGEVQLGLGDELQVAFGGRVVAAVRAAAPGVDVRFRPLSAASLDEGRRGVLDFAIAPDLASLPAIAGAIDYADFVTRELYRRRFVVLARAGTPAPDLAGWLAADHAIVSFDGGGRGFVDDLLAQRGLARRVVASFTSFPALAHAVASSSLLAVVPHEVAAAVGSRATFEVPIPLPELPILAVWHPRRTADPAQRFLRQVVSDAILAAQAARE